MRRLISPSRRLRKHFVDAAAPSLIVAEVTQAVLKYVRAELLEIEDARAALRDAAAIGIELHATDLLADAALVAATQLRLSAYDCFYLTLAEQLDVVLVTADRRLAAAAARAVVID